MKYCFSILILVLLVSACKQTALEKAPVPPQTMEKVLTDLQLAEVYSSMVSDSAHNVKPKNLDSLAKYYKQVFAHHNITQQQFDASLKWYKENPEQLDTAYKRMAVTLAQFESKQTAKK